MVLAFAIVLLVGVPFGGFSVHRMYRESLAEWNALVAMYEERQKETLKRELAGLSGTLRSRRIFLEQTATQEAEATLATMERTARQLMASVGREDAARLLAKMVEESVFGDGAVIVADTGHVVSAARGSRWRGHFLSVSEGRVKAKEGDGSDRIDLKKFAPLGWQLGVITSGSAIETRLRELFLYVFQNQESANYQYLILDREGYPVVNGNTVFPGYQEISDETLQAAGKEMVAASRKTGGGFFEIDWTVPSVAGTIETTKLLHLRWDAEFDWIIGVTADLREEVAVESEIRERIRNEYYQSIASLSVMMVVMFTAILLLGHYLTSKCLEGFAVFGRFFQLAHSRFEPIAPESMVFVEFQELAVVANRMVEDRILQEERITDYTRQLEGANRQLRRMAKQDGLTGVANRRYFDGALARAWLRCLREEKPLALGLIDIDFFKAYNDTYGHQEGDRCLRGVAQALQGMVRRPYDLVARYGGEEFVMLLPDTDREGAMQVARAMEKAVADLQRPHRASSAASVVTFSMGLAVQVPRQGENEADLLLAADQALYRAKETGRNRIVVA